MLHSINFIFFHCLCVCVCFILGLVFFFFFFGSLNMKFGPNDLLSYV